MVKALVVERLLLSVGMNAGSQSDRRRTLMLRRRRASAVGGALGAPRTSSMAQPEPSGDGTGSGQRQKKLSRWWRHSVTQVDVSRLRTSELQAVVLELGALGCRSARGRALLNDAHLLVNLREAIIGASEGSSDASSWCSIGRMLRLWCRGRPDSGVALPAADGDTDGVASSSASGAGAPTSEATPEILDFMAMWQDVALRSLLTAAIRGGCVVRDVATGVVDQPEVSIQSLWGVLTVAAGLAPPTLRFVSPRVPGAPYSTGAGGAGMGAGGAGAADADAGDVSAGAGAGASARNKAGGGTAGTPAVMCTAAGAGEAPAWSLSTTLCAGLVVVTSGSDEEQLLQEGPPLAKRLGAAMTADTQAAVATAQALLMLRLAARGINLPAKRLAEVAQEDSLAEWCRRVAECLRAASAAPAPATATATAALPAAAPLTSASIAPVVLVSPTGVVWNTLRTLAMDARVEGLLPSASTEVNQWLDTVENANAAQQLLDALPHGCIRWTTAAGINHTDVSCERMLQAAAAAKHRISLWRVVASLCDATRAVARVRTAVAAAGPSSAPWNTVSVALRDVDRVWAELPCVTSVTSVASVASASPGQAAQQGGVGVEAEGGAAEIRPVAADGSAGLVRATLRVAVARLETELAAVRLGVASHRITSALSTALPEGSISANSTSCEADVSAITTRPIEVALAAAERHVSAAAHVAVEVPAVLHGTAAAAAAVAAADDDARSATGGSQWAQHLPYLTRSAEAFVTAGRLVLRLRPAVVSGSVVAAVPLLVELLLGLHPGFSDHAPSVAPGVVPTRAAAAAAATTTAATTTITHPFVCTAQSLAHMLWLATFAQDPGAGLGRVLPPPSSVSPHLSTVAAPGEGVPAITAAQRAVSAVVLPEVVSAFQVLACASACAAMEQMLEIGGPVLSESGVLQTKLASVSHFPTVLHHVQALFCVPLDATTAATTTSRSSLPLPVHNLLTAVPVVESVRKALAARAWQRVRELVRDCGSSTVGVPAAANELYMVSSQVACDEAEATLREALAQGRIVGPSGGVGDIDLSAVNVSALNTAIHRVRSLRITTPALRVLLKAAEFVAKLRVNLQCNEFDTIRADIAAIPKAPSKPQLSAVAVLDVASRSRGARRTSEMLARQNQHLLNSAELYWHCPSVPETVWQECEAALGEAGLHTAIRQLEAAIGTGRVEGEMPKFEEVKDLTLFSTRRRREALLAQRAEFDPTVDLDAVSLPSDNSERDSDDSDDVTDDEEDGVAVLLTALRRADEVRAVKSRQSYRLQRLLTTADTLIGIRRAWAMDDSAATDMALQRAQRTRLSRIAVEELTRARQYVRKRVVRGCRWELLGPVPCRFAVGLALSPCSRVVGVGVSWCPCTGESSGVASVCPCPTSLFA